MRNMNLLAVLMVLPMLIAASLASAEVKVASPGKLAVVSLNLLDGQPEWSVVYNGRPVLAPAGLGLKLKVPYLGGFEQVGVQARSGDRTWTPKWGRFSTIRDHYNETVWQLREKMGQQRRLDIIVRAYDEGVALSYALHGTGSATLLEDQTRFSFPGDYTCWSANGSRPTIGPVPISEYDGYLFPLTVQVADHCYASILEAAIFTEAPISAKLAGDTDFITAFRSRARNKKKETQQAASQVQLPMQTSWRVLLLGETPGDLLTGNVLENLNPECALEDSSWIKPGLSLWDWRAWGGKTEDGFVYDLDMASWRRMIDFASKNGIEYLTIDANWYGHEFDPESDPMTSRDYIVYQLKPSSPKMGDRPAPENWEDPIDIPKIIKYAQAHDVGIFLYINDVARKNFDFEKTLSLYHEWGAKGIKYGFMGGAGQEKVQVTRGIIKLCAENQLMCIFHDYPVPPSGDTRTFPNCLAREFCHAQCDAARSFTPTTFCTMVFCNMLAGPLDMSNGFMTLTDLEKQRPKVFKVLNSTVTAEAARVLITFTGLACLPDTPESYESKADLFEFIAKLPMVWDETRILNGDIGKHITTARRAGRNWYIASCCDENGAELPIKFDFLEEGTTYQATFYEDTAATHFETNKESYRVRKGTVKKGDSMTEKLAPGGGHCILLEAMNPAGDK